MIKKSYSFMIITFLVMFFISSYNVKAWTHSVTLSTYTAHQSGQEVTNISTFNANFRDFNFYGIKTNSNSNFSTFNTANIDFTISDAVAGIGYTAFTIYFQSSDELAPTIRFDGTTCTLQSSAVVEIPLNAPHTNVANYSCYGNIYNTHNISVAGSNLYFVAISREIDISGAESDLLDKLEQLRQAILSISVNQQDLSEIKGNTSDIKNNTNDIKNEIKNDNIDSASSSASSWSSKNASNGTITQLLTLPITLLNAIVSGIQTSCNSFNLGNLFGTDIFLPCISLSSLIGNTLFTTIDLLISGFMIYNISKKLIKIFNDFTNLKSNQIDEIYGGGDN